MKIKELPLVGYIYTSLVIDILTAMIIFAIKNNLPPIVPLFYGRPVGTGQLVPVLGLLMAPAAALVITLVNMLLASFLTDNFLKRILAVSSFFISLLSAITIGKIILLVGFW